METTFSSPQATEYPPETKSTKKKSTEKQLTEKQKHILKFITYYIEQQGFPPTMQEICDEFQFSSSNAVTQYLMALDKKGFINRPTKGASRNIQVVKNTDGTPYYNKRGGMQQQVVSASYPSPYPPVSAPIFTPQNVIAQHTAQTVSKMYQAPSSLRTLVLIGQGISRNPLSVFLSPAGQLRVDMEFFCPNPDIGQQFFACPVEDEGMSAENIRIGDMVIVRQQFSASHGDMIVVLEQDMKLIRRLYDTGSGMEIVAANKPFPKIPYTENNADIAIIGVVVGVMRKI